MKYLIALIYGFLSFPCWSEGRMVLEVDSRGFDQAWTIYNSPGLKSFLSYGLSENPWPVAGVESEILSLGPLRFQGLVNIFSIWDSWSPKSGILKEKSGWFLSLPEKTWNKAGGVLRIPALSLSMGGRLVDGGGSIGLLFVPVKDPQITCFLELLSRSTPWDLTLGFYEPQDFTGKILRGVTGGKWISSPWILQSWSLGSMGLNTSPGLAVMGYLGYSHGEVEAALTAAWATKDFLGLEYRRKKMLGGMIKYSSRGFTGTWETSWELLRPHGPQGFLVPVLEGWNEVFFGEHLFRALGRFSQREKWWGVKGSLAGEGLWGRVLAFDCMGELQGGPESFFASVKTQISGGDDESPSFLSMGAEAHGSLGDLDLAVIFPGFSMETVEAQGNGNLYLGEWKLRISLKSEIIPKWGITEFTGLLSWEF
ncbi:MAG: hypothetical protein A2Z96_07330 [Spirochaetes bacterium GWB1_48_6]|nr:MAG: hypothetical protein A2Z96_07330 [Spirochaetes bacterium GWB1_48_6]